MHVAHAHVCGMLAFVALTRTHVRVQEGTRTHVKMECKKEMMHFMLLFSCHRTDIENTREM